MSYEEYLKSFYPHQEENVFTNNNWTLSDEVVGIFRSNAFYRQHVRWNVQRFRPCEVMNESAEVEDVIDASQPPMPTSEDAEREHSNDEEPQTAQQQLVIDEEADDEATQMSSKSACAKRKVGLNEDFPEYPTRTQPRRMKKN